LLWAPGHASLGIQERDPQEKKFDKILVVDIKLHTDFQDLGSLGRAPGLIFMRSNIM
jgi:hypothetical protein